MSPSESFAGRTGKGVRVAVIDSGVHAAHPHIGGVAGGVTIGEELDEKNYTDIIGHGTAVMAAIKEKAPDAEYFAVRVFYSSLRTTVDLLLRAIEWSIANRIDVINLSLGTTNPAHRERFAPVIARAAGKRPDPGIRARCGWHTRPAWKPCRESSASISTGIIRARRIIASPCPRGSRLLLRDILVRCPVCRARRISMASALPWPTLPALSSAHAKVWKAGPTRTSARQWPPRNQSGGRFLSPREEPCHQYAESERNAERALNRARASTLGRLEAG